MKYFHYNVRLMTIIGLYKIQTESTIKRLLFNFWRVTVNLCVLLFFMAVLTDLWIKKHYDFELIAIHYICLGGSLCYWLRMTYLLVYDDTSFEMVRELRDLFKYQTNTGIEEKDLGKYINFTNRLTLAFITYASLVGHCFVLLPLINSSERKLSLPIWYPFEWKSSPYYEIALLLQMFIQQVFATAIIGPDTFFASGLILLGAQFRLLGWEVKHVLHKTLLRNGVDLDVVSTYTSVLSDIQVSPLGEFYNSLEFKTELNQNLMELIKFHQSLVYLCARFDSFFSPTYLIYYCILIVPAVFIEYNLLVVKDIRLVLAFVMYLTAIAVTLLLPCSLGDFFTSQAEEFVHDIYDSPWYLCDRSFQTNFKMLHRSSCRPIRFTIGKFGFLSLATYVGIMKASVSYLAVLRQVTGER